MTYSSTTTTAVGFPAFTGFPGSRGAKSREEAGLVPWGVHWVTTVTDVSFRAGSTDDRRSHTGTSVWRVRGDDMHRRQLIGAGRGAQQALSRVEGWEMAAPCRSRGGPK